MLVGTVMTSCLMCTELPEGILPDTMEFESWEPANASFKDVTVGSWVATRSLVRIRYVQNGGTESKIITCTLEQLA